MTTRGGQADPAEESPDHYFSERPDVRSRPRTIRLDLPDRSLELGTDAGVFSPDRIDPGTKILLMELLEVAPTPAGSTVVDLGCGYGAIACTVAARHPQSRVIAVDVNERARDLCSANARRCGVEVEVRAPEQVNDPIEVDHLISNPPIRIGKAALHELLATWLDQLTPHGRAHLVVARHKGADSLVRWMEARGHRVERLRSRQGYRVLEVGPREAP